MEPLFPGSNDPFFGFLNLTFKINYLYKPLRKGAFLVYRESSLIIKMLH